MTDSTYIPDDLNPEYLFSTVANELLSKIVKGEIDPVEIARKTLRGRGLDDNGEWVGFDK